MKIFLFLAFCLIANSQDYLNQNLWEGVCQLGTRQSPIDIQTQDINGCDLNTCFEIDIDYKTQYTQIGYNQSNQDLKTPFTLSKIKFGRNGDSQLYKSLQYHFHRPSEHTVGGLSYDAEIHIVHSNQRGELAVYGFFFKVDQTENSGQNNLNHEKISNKLLSDPFDYWDLSNHKDHSITFPVHFDCNAKVYHYKGSLTTPPCSEGVQWFVNSQPILISAHNLQILAKLINENHPNNRKVQLLNYRRIDTVGKLCRFQKRQRFYSTGSINLSGSFSGPN